MVEGHSLDQTSMTAKTQMGRVLRAMNVRISSAWISLSSYPRVILSLKRLAAAAARSNHRATVFQERSLILEIADLLTPSTLNLTTSSKRRRVCLSL